MGTVVGETYLCEANLLDGEVCHFQVPGSERPGQWSASGESEIVVFVDGIFDYK